MCLFSKSLWSLFTLAWNHFGAFPGLHSQWYLNCLVHCTWSSWPVFCSPLQSPLLPAFKFLPPTYITHRILGTLWPISSTPQLSCFLYPEYFPLPQGLVNTYLSHWPGSNITSRMKTILVACPPFPSVRCGTVSSGIFLTGESWSTSPPLCSYFLNRNFPMPCESLGSWRQMSPLPEFYIPCGLENTRCSVTFLFK